MCIRDRGYVHWWLAPSPALPWATVYSYRPCDSFAFRLFFSTDAVRYRNASQGILYYFLFPFASGKSYCKRHAMPPLFGFLLAFGAERAAKDGCTLYPSLSSVSERSGQSSNIRSEDEASAHSIRRPQHSKSGRETLFVASQILRNRCKPSSHFLARRPT